MKIEIELSEQELKEAVMNYIEEGGYMLNPEKVSIDDDDIRFVTNDLGSMGLYTKAIIRKDES